MKKIIVFVLLSAFFFLLYKMYTPRLAAFGCFDDCFNYGAGYFITKGKVLYKDIFFNHQPIPAYLTAIIQTATHPINIYDLLLRHRQFLLLWAFVFDLLLIFRFGIPAFIFVPLFEVTKWYLFGDRFLAEGMIVYPLIYLTGIVWETMQNRNVSKMDLLLTTLSVWFILFSREPFIPVTLLLIGTLLIKHKSKHLSLLFLLLIFATLLTLPLKDYLFNVVTITNSTVLSTSIRELPFSERLIRMILYPFLILFSHHSHFYWQYLQGISLVFILGIFSFFYKKNTLWIFFWFVILALANIRAVSINTVFYQGFQLLPWYGVFLFLTQLVTISLLKTNRRAGIIFSFGLLIIFVRYITSPAVFFREHISPHEELITNYATEIQIGNVVRELSNPSDTFFLDGWGELIFWQANRLSPYRYSWYTSVMPLIPLYNEARKEMFTTNPPDFYFGSCPKEQNKERILPELVQPLYVNLSSGGNPTCLWVKKEKLAQITPNQWKKSQELLFDTPISHVQRNELPEVH